MNRPYTAQSPYSLTPTERIRYRTGTGTRDFEDADGAYGAHPDADRDTDVYPRYLDDGYDPYAPEDYDRYDDGYQDYDDPDGEEDDEIDEAHIDRRWMWIGGVAGAVLFVAVIATSLILSGGDSGSVSATVTSQLATSSAAPAPSQAPRAATPPTRSLPAETITTVTPSVEAPPAPSAAPAAPSLLPPPQAAPPPAAAPGTITYRVTGNRELIDLVTVIYTDQQGALQTELNVALPWSKTVVLDPGVTLSSVTATSVRGQLNCSITDAGGNLIASQNSNSIITNCTR